MTDGAKDVPIKISVSGYRGINIPIIVSLQATGAKDIPIKVTLQGDNVKDVPIKATLYPYRTDYGLYSTSQLDTAPRHGIFFVQGGIPDKSLAATDPYWYIKSGNSESGTEGFNEFGIGQNDDLDRTDAQIKTFWRIAQDTNEGWVKIKPSIWFYPSSEPTTGQEGMMYYDITTHTFKYYDGDSWETITTGSGMTAHDLTGAYHTEDATGGAGNVIVADSDTTFSWQQLDYSELSGTPSTMTPSAHQLDSATYHTVSGLTTGHFLKATGTTTYAFGAHGLTASDVGAIDSSTYGSHDHSAGDPTQVTYSDLSGIPSTFTPIAHDLSSAYHTSVLALTDLGSYARGSVIIGGSSDWTTLPIGTSTYVLTSDGTDISWQASAAGGPGSGTQWKLPVWATTTTLGDSMVSQDAGGTTLTIGGSFVLSAGATISDIDTAMAASPADTELLTSQGIMEYTKQRCFTIPFFYTTGAIYNQTGRFAYTLNTNEYFMAQFVVPYTGTATISCWIQTETIESAMDYTANYVTHAFPWSPTTWTGTSTTTWNGAQITRWYKIDLFTGISLTQDYLLAVKFTNTDSNNVHFGGIFIDYTA